MLIEHTMATNESRSVTKAEAFLNYNFDEDDKSVCNTVLSKQFEALVLNARMRMHTIALGYSNYFIVFKPLDKPYDLLEDRRPGYHANNGLNITGKKIMSLKPMQYVSSTEIYATKVHHNYIVKTSQDLVSLLHDKVYAHKYKVSCSLVENLNKCINYIYKEANLRVFKPNIDYNMKDFKKSPLYLDVTDLTTPIVAPAPKAELFSFSSLDEEEGFVWGLS